MSKQPNDSFLPSGAIDHFRKPPPFSPVSVPHSLVDYQPASNISNTASPNTFLHSQTSSLHTPMSPPKTRSASAEDNSAGLVEDWRAYAQKLRSQHQGERAHSMADRARIEEVMEEERQLWDKEREAYKARIAELEMMILATTGHSAMSPPPMSLNNGPIPRSAPLVSPPSASTSVAASMGSNPSQSVPQESGRDAEGRPLWAPTASRPSRTFDTAESSELRVDDISAPRDSAIRVTSKELTSSDFIQSPPSGPNKTELESIPELVGESIDISHIQPELDGVAIRVSAVSPTFAAKVLSPQRSPQKLSPDTKPPGRDITNLERPLERDRSVSDEIRTLHVVAHPENRRLTMHAGHTPNHSISKFPFLGDESGNATPTQANHHDPTEAASKEEEKSHQEAKENMEQNRVEEQEDRELAGPLGLINDSTHDDIFLQTLTEKLVAEARKSEGVSPTSESGSDERSWSPRRQRNTRREQTDDDEIDNEGPKLKLKPSFNFGRPMGSM